ncbi:MAG TPA: hypothetical protein VJQ46_05125 [Gemmatimonadales bacterium]|nr:hypothetical protein [Gemmatimonadales bacterium]
MGRTYRECPACGKRALSIATRCPVCGQELLDEPVRREAPSDRGRVWPMLVVGAVVLAIGAAALLIQRATSRGPEATSTAEVRAEVPVAVESRAAAPSVTPRRLGVPDSAPSAEAVSRVARTWTKVHERRSVKSDLSAVLLPGDTVLADSLRGGWWRVALEGKVIGYVFGPTLEETP